MKISFFEDGTYATGIDLTYIPEVPEIPGQEEIIEDGTIIQEFIETIPGIPASGREDCVFVADVDFNPVIQTIILVKSKGKYSVKIEDKPMEPETTEEKRSRVKSAFLEANDDEVSTELFEGEIFEGQELGDMLNQKLCSGNIYKEMQMHREVLDMFLPFLLESFGARLTEEQISTLTQIQSLGTRVKILLSHF